MGVAVDSRRLGDAAVVAEDVRRISPDCSGGGMRQ